MTHPTPRTDVDVVAELRRAVEEFPVIALRPDTLFALALAEIERMQRENAELVEALKEALTIANRVYAALAKVGK